MKEVKEQFDRTERWLKKIILIYQEKSFLLGKLKDYEENKDFIYAFFQNCYHIRDWLIASKVINECVVDNFIKTNTDMKICRDLCNGSKHLIISNPSIDKKIHKTLHMSVISSKINNKKPKIEIFYFINYKGTVLDSLELAVNCMQLWNNFFRKNNLI